jgi:hypothetical protein
MIKHWHAYAGAQSTLPSNHCDVGITPFACGSIKHQWITHRSYINWFYYISINDSITIESICDLSSIQRAECVFPWPTSVFGFPYPISDRESMETSPRHCILSNQKLPFHNKPRAPISKLISNDTKLDPPLKNEKHYFDACKTQGYTVYKPILIHITYNVPCPLSSPSIDSSTGTDPGSGEGQGWGVTIKLMLYMNGG